jgi:hypothetical protein
LDHIAMSTDLIRIHAAMTSISAQPRRDDWKTALRERFPIARSAGIECFKGWQPILARMLERLEAAIPHQPVAFRRGLKVKGMGEKFGVLTVYLSNVPTPEVQAIIDEADAAALVTCEVCGAPGRMADRHGWISVKCDAHENWCVADGFDDGLREPA